MEKQPDDLKFSMCGRQDRLTRSGQRPVLRSGDEAVLAHLDR